MDFHPDARYVYRRNVVATWGAVAALVMSYLILKGTLGTFEASAWRRPLTSWWEVLYLGAGAVLAFGGVINLVLLYLSDRLVMPKFITRWSFFRLLMPEIPSSQNSQRNLQADELAQLAQKVAEVQRAHFTPTNEVAHEEVIEKLVPLVSEGVGDALRKQFASEVEQDKRTDLTRKTFQFAERRLTWELESLRKRANLNLAIGFATTIAAIGVLLWLLPSEGRPMEDLNAILTYYIPRVTIAIFIEVFAFFFLKMYRATLAEIRLYQADVTRLNLQAVCVELAGQSEALRSFAETLVERPSPEKAVKMDESVDVRAVISLVEKLSKLLPQSATKST